MVAGAHGAMMACACWLGSAVAASIQPSISAVRIAAASMTVFTNERELPIRRIFADELNGWLESSGTCRPPTAEGGREGLKRSAHDLSCTSFPSVLDAERSAAFFELTGTRYSPHWV